MKVQELRTILDYADIQQDQKVQVRVRKGEKKLTSVEIQSFNVYADAIVLYVELDGDF